MAVHAPLHRHLHPRPCRGLLTLADIPVTLLAFEFSQGDMAAMGKEDVIRLPIKMFPGDLLSSLRELSDFFLLGVLREGVFVTLQAGGQCGHSGKGLVFIVRVTGKALNALLLMAFVIEGDGLPSPSANPETEEEEEETETYC
jgi:hypothetical protein